MASNNGSKPSVEEKKGLFLPKESIGVLLGAAFLMATSAVGPGQLTQVASFTEQFGANVAFLIFIVFFLGTAAQLIIWRVITVSGLPGQDVANKVFPGLGSFVAFAVALGGLAFNVGNVGGTGLGLNVLFGFTPRMGAVISAIIAIVIFTVKEAGKAIDRLSKYLGLLMIVLLLYVAIATKPPIGEAMLRIVAPTKVSLLALITVLGSAVGGYITFSGAHRLLDAGIKGQEKIGHVDKSAITGMGVLTIVRFLLFLAVLGVVSTGAKLDPSNPAASALNIGAGIIGYKVFGVVLWCAAITSVVGASYTSVSFLRTLSKHIDKYSAYWIIGFIIASTMLFLFVEKPVQLLILASSFNGLILPLTLSSMLMALRRKDIIGDYKNPIWLTVLGIVVVCISAYAGISSIKQISALWNG